MGSRPPGIKAIIVTGPKLSGVVTFKLIKLQKSIILFKNINNIKITCIVITMLVANGAVFKGDPIGLLSVKLATRITLSTYSPL